MVLFIWCLHYLCETTQESPAPVPSRNLLDVRPHDQNAVLIHTEEYIIHYTPIFTSDDMSNIT